MKVGPCSPLAHPITPPLNPSQPPRRAGGEGHGAVTPWGLSGAWPRVVLVWCAVLGGAGKGGISSPPPSLAPLGAGCAAAGAAAGSGALGAGGRRQAAAALASCLRNWVSAGGGGGCSLGQRRARPQGDPQDGAGRHPAAGTGGIWPPNYTGLGTQGCVRAPTPLCAAPWCIHPPGVRIQPPRERIQLVFGEPGGKLRQQPAPCVPGGRGPSSGGPVSRQLSHTQPGIAAGFLHRRHRFCTPPRVGFSLPTTPKFPCWRTGGGRSLPALPRHTLRCWASPTAQRQGWGLDGAPPGIGVRRGAQCRRRGRAAPLRGQGFIFIFLFFGRCSAPPRALLSTLSPGAVFPRGSPPINGGATLGPPPSFGAGSVDAIVPRHPLHRGVLSVGIGGGKTF